MKTIVTWVLAVVLLGLLAAFWPIGHSVSRPVTPELTSELSQDQPELATGAPARGHLSRSASETHSPQQSSTVSMIGATAAESAAFRLSDLEAESDACRRTEAIQRAADSVPDRQLGTALNSLLGNTNSAAVELSQRLVRRWAESAPAAAAAWAQALSGDEPLRSEALRQVVIAWADTDLPGAAAWVQALPAGSNDKQAAALSLGYEASRTEPMSALELAGELPPGSERDELLLHAVSQWAGSDPSSARDWVGQVSDTVLRGRLLETVAVAASARDGVAGATIVASALSPGQAQDRAAYSVALRWAAQSPQEAIAWVTQFPEGALRADALRAVSDVSDRQAGQTAKP